MMASKYLYDEGVEEEVFNDEWAENADVEKEEMNRMERDFLDALDWELFIKKNEFDHTMLSIERSIALREGLKRGWFSYTDLCILWDDPRLEFWVTDIGLEWLKVALVSSAAYFAAAMTMVGSTVLVTNASLMLASPGVLPVLLPGLQPMGLPQSSPLSQLYGLPSLPALEFPADAFPGGSAGYQQNETADAAKAEELGPEPTNPDVSSVPGKTVVETIMSQLMAVLTLKSHLVQFVSAVADNYTSARSRSTTSKWHDTGLDCTSETGTVFTSDPDMASTADACSRWLEMKKSYGSSAAAGPQETCHCCGEMLAGRDRDGFRSLQFMFPGACSRPLATGHCVDVGEVKVDIFTQPTPEEIKERNPEVKQGGVWSPADCTAWQKVAIIIPYRDRYRFLMILLNRLHPMLQRQQLSYRIFVIEQCHVYNYAGGVIAMNRENYNRINGYSNSYWGWGNEDDDFSAR
nr:hypothetical protein BaRGS_027492 [Batillaria attramentaria]